MCSKPPPAAKLLQILVEPIEPDAIYVGQMHGRAIGVERVHVEGKMSSHGKGDEFHGDTVILERVVHLV